MFLTANVMAHKPLLADIYNQMEATLAKGHGTMVDSCHGRRNRLGYVHGSPCKWEEKQKHDTELHKKS